MPDKNEIVIDTTGKQIVIQAEPIHEAQPITLRSPKPEIYKFDGAIDLRTWQDVNGNPIFAASDVCMASGHKKPREAVDRLDPDEKGVVSIATLGGPQICSVVTEAGFYNLIGSFRLRKDNPNHAILKRFKRWVNHEVLPSIRRTGQYAGGATIPDGQRADADTPVDLAELAMIQSRLLTAALQGVIENRRDIAEIRQQFGEFASQVKSQASQAKAIAFKASNDIKSLNAMIDSGIIAMPSAPGEGALRSVTAQPYSTPQAAEFLTIKEYADMRGIPLRVEQLRDFGRRLSAECRDANIATGVRKSAHHDSATGSHAYPREMLDRWEPKMRERIKNRRPTF